MLKQTTKIMSHIIFLMLMFVSCMSVAASIAPLPSEQAFGVTTTILSPNTVMVDWRVTPRYYLYAKRIHFSFEPQTEVNIRIPQGDLKYDATLGRLEVLSGNVTVPITFKSPVSSLRMTVNYQGCAEDGFCYPPVRKTFVLNFASHLVTQEETSIITASTNISNSSLISLTQDQNHVRALFDSMSLGYMLLIFVGIGLLLTFTPCVLPMIPIITTIVVGQKGPASGARGFLLSSTYVLGSSLTYAFAGVFAVFLGGTLQAWLQQTWVVATVSVLFALLALSLLGVYELSLPSRLQNRLMQWSDHQKGGTYLGVFVMGVISALIVSPCVTAPLAGVLMYISQTNNLLLGGASLFALGFGMGIPLILIGMSAGKWLPKAGPWMEFVKRAMGLLMLGMALWLLSRIVSATIMPFLVSVFVLGVIIYLSISLAPLIGVRKWSHRLSMLAGFSGALLIIGLNQPNWLPDWTGGNVNNSISAFRVIRDMPSLDKELLIAHAAGKPVILDFYADWCSACVTMDRNVFGLSQVRNVLTDYVLLRADLTTNNTDDQAIMKKFNVVAPPTVLFFDANGRELNNERIIGEVNAKEFLTRIGKLSLSRN